MDASAFHPAVERWFRSAFKQPTAAQRDGWEQIAAGRHTLIEAPTGSGKTLAAFLWCLNDLVCHPAAAPGVQVLYISPLKALNNDIQRNMETPLAGLRTCAAEMGLPVAGISVDVRTGDTPPAQRSRQIRRPPDIFITTPESLYLLLTSSRSQGMFRTLRYVILDEIHAIASTKRGVHLALSLERLETLVRSQQPPSAPESRLVTPTFIRIGLSATQRPLETVARLLGGYDDDGRERPVSIVQAQQDKCIDLDVTYPLGEPAGDGDFMQRCAQVIVAESATRRSTLVFCNARHVTERLAEVVNKLAGQQVAVAHHGSISREQRLETELALKEGRLPLLIATSSLELGIDIGSVDLVIQIGSTRSVSRAMQRVGRAGHQVGAVSRGRILAQHPSDLLDAAACVRGVRARNIETTHVPQACLDVLAQQIVAMTAAQPWTVDGILRVARRALPFHSLSRAQLENVLAMLAGRYADVRFEGLRPRIEWDAGTDEVRGRPGALRVAVINGGTIPDRGYMPVELIPSVEGQPGKRLGELDEEFAAELYVGGRPAFALGTSVWGVEAVQRDRVLVRPAPGEPYQIPFWRGDRLARTVDYGVPKLVRDISVRLRQQPAPEREPERASASTEEAGTGTAPGRSAATAWLRETCGLDESATDALIDYVRRQEEAAGLAPSDQTILIESFRDEIGDGRLVIHSLFGGMVNGAWAFALKPRLREALGGIDPLVMHNDDGIIIRLPPMELEIEPFARSLLEQVRADTVEELLIGELADAPMLGLRFREAAQRALLLPKPRPDRRTPLWLRRQRAADLLSIVRRKEGFPVLQEAVRECLHDSWDLNGLRSVLRGIEAGEIALPFVETASPSPFAGSLVWDFGLAFGEADDAPRGECRAAYLALNRDLLRETLEAEDLRQLLDTGVIAEVEAALIPPAGASAPAGSEKSKARVPTPSGPQRDQAIRELLHAYMQTSGPASAADIAQRLKLPLAETTRQLNVLVEASQLSCGEYRPDGADLEYCAPLILARLHRESLRRAREQIAPVDPARYAAFLPLWHGAGQPHAVTRRALSTLHHLPLTRDQWQAILTSRFGPDFSAPVDGLTSRGLLQWRSAGNNRLELAPVETARTSPPASPEAAPMLGFGTEQVLALLRGSGALFTSDIARRLARTEPPLSLPEVEHALALLEDAGFITNDLFSHTGRWSVAEARAGADAAGQVEALLMRYGVVCREVCRAEKRRWADVERVLKMWEWRGRALRGDFVRHLSGPQFALREAVELLRQEPAGEAPLLLSWEDPANPWGKVLPLPAPRGKGRFILLLGGQPLLTITGWGKELQPAGRWSDDLAEVAAPALRLLAVHSPTRQAALERWRGGSILVSPLAAPLREAGFVRAGLRLVHRPRDAARLDLAV